MGPYRDISQWCPHVRSTELGQGLANGSIDMREFCFFPVDKDGLINLTVSLIMAEIIGLCQRSGS